MRFIQVMDSFQRILNLLNDVKKKELFSLVQNRSILDMFGDKVKARTQAELANIPVIPGTDGPVTSVDEVIEFW